MANPDCPKCMGLGQYLDVQVNEDGSVTTTVVQCGC
jgi:hypothetical protein